MKAAAGQRTYTTKMKVSDEEMKQIKLTKEAFHGEWNYAIRPTRSDG